jgi:hypothetical protein
MDGDLNPDVARHLLTLGFSEEDKARMHNLAVRNQEGALAPAEVEELHIYAEIGCIFGILHSKARKVLKQTENQLPDDPEVT